MHRLSSTNSHPQPPQRLDPASSPLAVACLPWYLSMDTAKKICRELSLASPWSPFPSSVFMPREYSAGRWYTTNPYSVRVRRHDEVMCGHTSRSEWSETHLLRWAGKAHCCLSRATPQGYGKTVVMRAGRVWAKQCGSVLTAGGGWGRCQQGGEG